jgi:2-isopropylmalate synthase
MTTKQRIFIYDTTLRDGTQGEGVSFSASGKVRLARRLDDLGVDYIEGGFPGSNPKDESFFETLRKQPLRTAKLVAFGCTRRPNVRAAHDEAVVKLVEAGTPAVTVFGKSWTLHVRDVLRTTPDENLAMISETVRFLKAQKREVLFDAEHFFDGYKDSPAFALSTVRAAVEAGADMVVLCDTNGGSMPEEVYAITGEVMRQASVPLGIHTHNDSGLAVAASLEAVRAGATQVQGTINGYGERCGNANLCTLVPTLILKMGRTCLKPGGLKDLRDVSLFVDELANMRHDAKAPYVGESAFSHKAGMHVNAVEKNPRTFEHVDPALVGNERRILVSEGSGTSSILMKALELGVGITKSSGEAREVLQALKDLENKGYAFEAADASFRILIQKILKKHKAFFDLEGFRVIVEKRGRTEPCISEATIKVRVKETMEHAVAEGDGPVHALDTALRKVLTRFYPEIAKVVLRDFQTRILDPEHATAARTRVIIESSDGKETWGTVGVSENIIEAAWEALVDSVEYKLFREEERASEKARNAGE